MPATRMLERSVEQPETGASGSYDGDFHAWTIEQALALREGRLSDLDRENLAEEIEDLGKFVFNGLRSSFRVILLHMLKWDHQPERRSRSWVTSIRTHRIDLEEVLSENPSLRRRQVEAIEKAYRTARIKAASEMKRDENSLPASCPYSLDDILSRPFDWPVE